MGRGGARLLGCFALWSAGVAAACNSIAGLDAEYELAENVAAVDSGGGTSSGATSGGTSGSSGTSGGSSGAADAEPDAPGDSDSGPPEAGTLDAEADAADTGMPDASTRLCPLTGALICDDFEDVTVGPNFGWDGNESEGALDGSPTVGPQLGFGDSRGLRARGNAAQAAETSAKVLLYRALAANQFPKGSTLTLRLRFNVTQADLAYAAIAVFQFSGFEYGLAVHNHPNCPLGPSGRICVDENNLSNAPPQLSNARAIELGTWYAAEIRVSRSETDQYGGTVVLHTDPPVTLDTRTPTSGSTPSGLQVRVGMFYTSDQNAVTDVRIDDVTVVRTTP
jgi:hypothetical protein